MFYPFFITFKEKPGLLNIPQKLEASFQRFKISPRAPASKFYLSFSYSEVCEVNYIRFALHAMKNGGEEVKRSLFYLL